MAKRSLKASEAGRTSAKKAFERTGWTQEYLAYQVGLETRQSVWKFFSGRPVDRNIFIDLCFQLELDWEEISEMGSHLAGTKNTLQSLESEVALSEIKALLAPKLRDQLQLTLMPFDFCQPLPLQSIYTPLYFLPAPSHQRWLEVNELCPRSQDYQRRALTPNSLQNQPAIESVQSVQKLVILGKPGAGKTTFLQYLALNCLDGSLYSHCLPIYISLRSLVAEYRDQVFPRLETYIQNKIGNEAFGPSHIEDYLRNGRFLLLVDGLDEISTQDFQPLFTTLQQWANTHASNPFILTCRVAAQRSLFHGFTYVELADFNPEQIEQFVRQFFTAVSVDLEQGEKKAQDFLEQLYRKQNQPIRELVTTPILLNLICSIFQERKTLPANRAKLYQVGLDILLGRWDQARGIHRKDHTSFVLSKVERLKLLSYLAAKTFAKEQLFFNKQDAIHIVSQYFQEESSKDDGMDLALADVETLWDYSEQAIQIIEMQNGLLVERAKEIYSFSHLTFQEYLTARKIVASPKGDHLQTSLEELAVQINHPHWREVIFLTVNLLPDPMPFLGLMQQHLLHLIPSKSKLHKFMMMIQNKIMTLNSPYPKWALRAFYFSMLINADLKLAFTVEPLFANQLSDELSLDLALIRLLNKMEQMKENFSIQTLLNIYFALNFDEQFRLSPSFRQAVSILKAELPEYASGKQSQLDWWQYKGNDWIKQWYDMISEYRGLSLNWQWSSAEASVLQHYYQGNQLLVDCIQFEARLPETHREQIMAQLLCVKG